MDIRRKLVSELLSKIYAQNPVGSLSNLRRALREMNPTGETAIVAGNLVAQAHLCCFNLIPGADIQAVNLFSRAGNTKMLEELLRLGRLYRRKDLLQSLGYEENFPESPWIERQNIDSEFQHYCQLNNLIILRTLQRGIEDVRRCSWVYLVWDPDGIVKIYKEVLNYHRGPLGKILNNEDEIYAQLPENLFFPKYYGIVEIEGGRFIRQSVHFGRTLSEVLVPNQLVAPGNAQEIIRGTAEAIDFLHENGIIYLDVKPGNILVDKTDVKMLDLGISRMVPSGGEIDVFLADPQYGTPEGGTKLKGSPASDVFQLGILFHQLLTGKHPFDLAPLQADDNLHRESAILRYFWPTTVLSYDNPCGLMGDTANLVQQMLDPDPQKRPSAIDVANRLSGQSNFSFVQLGGKSPRSKTRNIILFPARMGIPHKGHIEYIARLLNLGYHVLIAIEHAFTITDRDPIPKSLVMKMVARSLIDCGFVPDEDFSFVFTPYYETRRELEFHYLTMPQIGNVVAIASGNPEVHDLFRQWPIFDQKTVFGTEGEVWETRSWGENLRQAIREGDYQTFREYASSGVEKILSFEELQAMYGQPNIEFAKSVTVVMTQDGNEVFRGRIFQYSNPENMLIFYLKNRRGYKVSVIDFYERNTKLEIDGQASSLVYQRTELDPLTKHETIYFGLTQDTP